MNLDIKEVKLFSRKEVKQLWDDLKVRSIWFFLVNSGKRVYSKELKKELTEESIIDQFSKIRAILWALGTPLKIPKKKNIKKINKKNILLYEKAIPLIQKYLKSYQGKVKKDYV